MLTSDWCSVTVLILTIMDRVIRWYEAVTFLCLYVLYCVFMAFNPAVEAWASKTLPVPASWRNCGKEAEGNNQEMDGMEEGRMMEGAEAEDKKEE